MAPFAAAALSWAGSRITTMVFTTVMIPITQLVMSTAAMGITGPLKSGRVAWTKPAITESIMSGKSARRLNLHGLFIWAI